jgi:hypothetical protein
MEGREEKEREGGREKTRTTSDSFTLFSFCFVLSFEPKLHNDLPASASRVLELLACANTSSPLIPLHVSKIYHKVWQIADLGFRGHRL